MALPESISEYVIFMMGAGAKGSFLHRLNHIKRDASALLDLKPYKLYISILL